MMDVMSNIFYQHHGIGKATYTCESLRVSRKMYLVNFDNKNLHIIGSMSMRSLTFNRRNTQLC